MTAVAVAILLLTAAAVAYAAECWVAPWSPCGRCDGRGEKRRWLRKPKRCWRCRGEGRRLKWGRRLWNGGSRIHDKGTKR